MKLYEVDSEILRLLCLLEPDPETGEIPENEEQLLTELNGLQMEREHILEYLAKVVLNNRAEQAMLKIEEARLYERRKKLEAKEDRLMRVLDRECDGKNTNLGIATFRYRATTKIEMADRAKAVNWLRRHKYKDAIRVMEPEVDKTVVRQLLKNGAKIPGLALLQSQSCSLK